MATPSRPEATLDVNTLLLFSKGFGKRIVDLYNEAHFGRQASTRLVDSWADILKVLAEFNAITNVVFLVHSNPGMFLFCPDAFG